MKIRPITLRLENGDIKQWDPLDIKSLHIAIDYVRINSEVVKKSDVYWPHWTAFHQKLINLFKIELY